MAKLDRLGWADGIAFRSHTARLGIRINSRDVIDRVSDRLPPGWRRSTQSRVDILYSLVVGSNGDDARVRRFNLLYVGSGRIARTMELTEALTVLESDLHMRVSLFARNRLFVHAGVVGWRGRAIVIPGRSETGKSSLVEALVRAGGTYYSDEFAVFDGRGRVHPYTKPLSLRQPGGGPPKQVPAHEMPGPVGQHPIPLGLVVDTRYRPDAQFRPRRATRAQAMMALFDNTVLARIRPGFAMQVLDAAVTGTEALRGARGEADGVARVLLERAGGAAR
jgi:hypothetical protein